MPNHIKNRLRFEGGNPKALKIAIQGKNGATIDFNKIRPMRSRLREKSSDLEAVGIAKALWGIEEDWHYLERANDKSRLLASWDFERVDAFMKYLENLRQCGYAYWHDWAINNWGTKWNAYGMPDERDGKREIWFETAWSPPLAVIEELSAQWPEMRFDLTYADEDWGYNQGLVAFKEGKVVREEDWGDGSEEAIQRTKEMHGVEN